MSMTATYSPEDNKLRLKPSTRLDAATYDRVKAAGFAWAPKQGFFVAGMWTPEREDLLLRLCGGIDDEDTTLVDRAAERAERFEGYRERRIGDAEAAHRQVHDVMGRFEPGQPILVGHHSQRRAEKDKERIEQGMRRAVNLFETAQYWQRRAAGARLHAEYKADPEVRYRRIKGLEADERKFLKQLKDLQTAARLWAQVPRAEWDRQDALALLIAGQLPYAMGVKVRVPGREDRVSLYSALDSHGMKGDTAWRIAVPALERAQTRPQRWLDHTRHRIAYEKALLGESGGIAADRYDLQPGGRVRVRGEWVSIVRVNRKGGQVVSVTTNARYVSVRSVEEIQDYEAPKAQEAAAAQAINTLAPLCNYEHESFVKLTKAEYAAIHADYKSTRTIGQGAKGDRYGRIDVTPFEAYGRHRVRCRIHGHQMALVFLTDQKVTSPPTTSDEARPVLTAPVRDETPRRVYQGPEPTKFDALKDALRAGIQAVAAPQLFPTPMPLAERMVELAGIVDGDRILEPSAGTGNLIQALRATGKSLYIVAVEINAQLAGHLRQMVEEPTEVPQAVEVIGRDFLEPLAIGTFSRVLMNPPFANGADIVHIERALGYLAPGGLLVAICAGGPRQERRLMPLALGSGGIWEPLPAGTFTEVGTNVSTVLLTIHKR